MKVRVKPMASKKNSSATDPKLRACWAAYGVYLRAVMEFLQYDRTSFAKKIPCGLSTLDNAMAGNQGLGADKKMNVERLLRGVAPQALDAREEAGTYEGRGKVLTVAARIAVEEDLRERAAVIAEAMPCSLEEAVRQIMEKAVQGSAAEVL